MKTTEISIEPMGLFFNNELDLLKHVGTIAGECYNSNKDFDACVRRARNCIMRGHHSPWEHVNITLKCTVDRGVSHALVRHRHCAFQQSSTIYQKYDELVFIKPNEVRNELLETIEAEYKDRIKAGIAPGEARDALPNCLATNLIITTNFRQWMYMIHRRCGPGDSNKMHIWCQKTREWFEQNYPEITSAFDTWYLTHPL